MDMINDASLRQYNATAARQLLPDDVRTKLPSFASVSGVGSSAGLLVHLRFFAPTGDPWEWFVLGGDPSDDDFLFYGFVVSPGTAGEFGPFGLRELRSLHLGFSLGVERDVDFEPRFFSELFPALIGS